MIPTDSYGQPLLRAMKLLQIAGIKGATQFSRQWIGKEELVRFNVRGCATPVYCRRDTADVHVLWQVFGQRQYAFRLSEPPATIVDAGANVGYTSLYFAMRYPQARIVAIEPEPGNCEVFRLNCGHAEQIRLLEAALWPNNAGKLHIASADVSSWSFQVMDDEDDASSERASIQAVTIPEILSNLPDGRIDLLKLDIEGSERWLFEAAPLDWLSKVKSLSVECHDRIFPGTSELVTETLVGNSFELLHRTEELMVFSQSQSSLT